MDFSLKEILNLVGQNMLVPCMIVLLGLIVVTVWQLGDILVEFFLERRKTKVNITELLKKINLRGSGNLREVIETSGLSRRHKEAFFTLIESKHLPQPALIAMAQRLLATEEVKYQKTTAITDLVSRLGPMFGLLGTLIPLGPGIEALSRGDTVTLAISISTAFDTTIAGVLVGAISYVISSIRKRWYNDSMISLEAIMECVLEEVSSLEDKKRNFSKSTQVTSVS